MKSQQSTGLCTFFGLANYIRMCRFSSIIPCCYAWGDQANQHFK